MKKNLVFVSIVIVTCFLMTACGNNEKIDQIQTAYKELNELSNQNSALIQEAMNNYAEIDQQTIDEYNAAVEWMSDFGSITLNGKSDEELDEIMNQILEMKEVVNRAIGAVEAANEIMGTDNIEE